MVLRAGLLRMRGIRRVRPPPGTISTDKSPAPAFRIRTRFGWRPRRPTLNRRLQIDAVPAEFRIIFEAASGLIQLFLSSRSGRSGRAQVASPGALRGSFSVTQISMGCQTRVTFFAAWPVPHPPEEQVPKRPLTGVP